MVLYDVWQGWGGQCVSDHVFHHDRRLGCRWILFQDRFRHTPHLASQFGDGDGFPVRVAQQWAEGEQELMAMWLGQEVGDDTREKEFPSQIASC